MLMLIIIKLLILLLTLVTANNNEITKVLLFGGNGFIGSHVTLNLLRQQMHLVNLTIVSRGNWPYDTYDTVQPFVQHISCDRYYLKGLKSCDEFMNFIQHNSFDYVVDFSAYEPYVIKDALQILKNKIGLYIYISSDSVYEVS
jgi:nucleoside-diphosphate-sugar epimerase